MYMGERKGERKRKEGEAEGKDKEECNICGEEKRWLINHYLFQGWCNLSQLIKHTTLLFVPHVMLCWSGKVSWMNYLIIQVWLLLPPSQNCHMQLSDRPDVDSCTVYLCHWWCLQETAHANGAPPIDFPKRRVLKKVTFDVIWIMKMNKIHAT